MSSTLHPDPAVAGCAAAPAEVVSDAPPKHEVFGVMVSRAEPGEVVDCVMRWASARRSATVNFMPVHGLMEARKPVRREAMNGFDLNACDGQPVRWAMNRFHRAGLRERAYGPSCMEQVCERAAVEGIGVYLYGSSPEVIRTLDEVLPARFPGLVIAGAESPPYRALTAAEEDAVIERINTSGAGVVFLGIGCPKQEDFAAKHRDRIHAVQMCVGAAFDFHAGKVSMAPAWMQRQGLEWLYRLTREPRRLWKRYLHTNSAFVGLFVRRALIGR